MSILKLLSPSEQVAAHLREELLRGRWMGTMPGVPSLAADLGVDRKTVDAALRQLDEEGILEPQGPGRRRKIVGKTGINPPSLRVAFLFNERKDMNTSYLVDLKHELEQAGHRVTIAPQTLIDLRMDVSRISRLVEKTSADAWVVLAASRAVLEWFADYPVPAFALFGRRRGLEMAGTGPDKPPAFVAVAERLVELGHRRIALMARSARRLPEPGATEQAFLDALESKGVTTGPFNLPDWPETIDGFYECLASLFAKTPPTALVVDEAPFFVAAQQFLAERGLKVPADVSLICTDADSAFAWCKPAISHICWDSQPVVRRVVNWAKNVKRGKVDVRQSQTKAEFVEGGTIGRVEG
ncbi:MAG: DNA-binding LacI/PurR family transcriptional regulator [Verrucomicrobiales bacterium]|jgi:DNA-binding LacI/PurR family transcriptional regulator